MNEDNLQKELSEGRKEIKTDSYSMSIGELLNLYNEEDLQLDPAYQRLFRWSDEQKSKKKLIGKKETFTKLYLLSK